MSKDKELAERKIVALPRFPWPMTRQVSKARLNEDGMAKY